MKDKIKKEVLEEFRFNEGDLEEIKNMGEQVTDGSMNRVLDNAINLTTQKTAQAIFDDIESKHLIYPDHFTIYKGIYQKLKKKWLGSNPSKGSSNKC